MEETIVRSFIDNGVDGMSPRDHYDDNTYDQFSEGQEVVGTVRILGGRRTKITIHHPEHAERLQSEAPPRYGYLGRFTATVKNKYRATDRITLTDIRVDEIEEGSQLPDGDLA